MAESTDRRAAQAGTVILQVFDELMVAVFEARARLAQPPPSHTHAHLVEQLRQFYKPHRDSSQMVVAV